MSNLSPSNPPNNISAAERDLASEIRRIWGVEWNKPSAAYEFSNGRKFELRTEDAAIYKPQEPITALTPVAWYRYGIGLTDAGAGACSAWADQSGNGHDLTAAGSARPTIQSDSSLLFDGTANTMAASAFTFNQPCTYYFLLKQKTWTSGDFLFNGIGAQATIIQNGVSPNLDFNAGSTVTGVNGLVLDTYGVLCVEFNGASSLLQLNNNAAATGNAGANNPGGLRLGSASGAAAFANIQVKEVILFAAAHNATQRATVITYLATVGGLNI